MLNTLTPVNAIAKKARAVLYRGLPSLRNKLFAQFGYWPVESVSGHWFADTPVYCISLLRAQQRRDVMRRQVEKMRLSSFRFVDAVDARTLTRDGLLSSSLYDPEKTLRWHSRELTLNEVACSLSHIECYRQIAAAQHRWAVVIEDDALFLTRHLLRLRLEDIPEWSEIVFLNSFLDGDGREARSEERITSDTRYFGSAAGYMISAATASRLLSEAPPVIHAADGLLGRALQPIPNVEGSFRGSGSWLGLRGVIASPQVIINGSVEHYTRTQLR